MKRGYSLVTIHSRTSRRYQVEFWSQPWRHWLVAKIYHWYDMRIFRVPGFKGLENWLHDRHGDDPLAYLPLGIRQDLRCYYLTEKKRIRSITLRITAEEYQALGGRSEGGEFDREQAE